MKKVIYAGSFDPITKGHLDISKRAAEKSETLIIGVGQNPDKKYMFSFPERVEMIKGAIKGGVNKLLNVEVLPYSGLLVDFAYEEGAQTIVRGLRGEEDLNSESTIHWVGESQKLGIDTIYLLAKQDKTHISSGATKAILKEQGLIEDYVSLNVKHHLEARMKGQYLIGLTGSIGSGKSYITQKFVELGKQNHIEIHNIDLDKIGHWILGEAKDEGYKRIRQELVDTFGEAIRKEDGFIERKMLGEIVFHDTEKRKQLDKILFTPILLKIRKEISNKKGIILLNGALLAEAGMTQLSNNNIVLVGVEKKVQQERLHNRGHSHEQIERRINSQFCTEKKKKVIADNINTSGYGSLVEFENNGDNQNEIQRHFNTMLSNVDIYGGLRIKSIFQKLGIAEKGQQLYKEIKALYDTPERRYHNWFHIVACLNNLYEIKEKISEDDFNILFFAIIFHDCIYNATAKKGENEENSALFAEKYLEKIGIEGNKEKIKNLIQLTAGHTLKKGKDIEKYMIDIDLSILGSNWETYLQYTKSIRHEYSQYSDETYRKGRLDFLQGIQQRKFFQTPYFQEKYEKQARKNIEKEIEILKK